MLDVLSRLRDRRRVVGATSVRAVRGGTRRDPGHLRIGYTLKAAMDAPLDPECERADASKPRSS